MAKPECAVWPKAQVGYKKPKPLTHSHVSARPKFICSFSQPEPSTTQIMFRLLGDLKTRRCFALKLAKSYEWG